MDLFASRLTAQCPLDFSWQPDPYATTADTFLLDCDGISFGNPPWDLTGCAILQSKPELKCPPGPSGTSVKVSAMVSSPSGNTGGLPTSITKKLSGDDQPRFVNPNTATGHVAYLRDRYRSLQLSEELRCGDHAQLLENND